MTANGICHSEMATGFFFDFSTFDFSTFDVGTFDVGIFAAVPAFQMALRYCGRDSIAKDGDLGKVAS